MITEAEYLKATDEGPDGGLKNPLVVSVRVRVG
jgi:hypothetical protein